MMTFALRTITYSSSILLSFLVYSISVSLIPHTIWFNYESVEPVKDTFAIGEPIYFDSKLDVYKDVYFHWVDTIRCASANGNNLYIFVSEGSRTPGSYKDDEAWIFNGPTPTYSATCKAQHDITIKPFLGAAIKQTVFGKTFTIE